MTIRIKRAETAEEMAGVLRLRHEVFVDEEAFMPASPDRHLVDRFDAYPTIANVIATVDGQVVGTLRGCEDSPAGTPADEFFDFRPHLPDGARMLSASMYMVSREYRDVPYLGVGILGTALYWAVSRGVSHVVAPCNPDRRDLFAGLGFREVAPQSFDEAHGLPYVPMALDLAELDDFFVDYLRRQQVEHWLETFHRQIHAAGEHVVRRGGPGDAAFVVIEGKAEVRSPDGTRAHVLGRGEMFGELALLSDEPRTADVVATEPLQLLVLPREEFRQQLRQDPDRAMHALSVVARRMSHGLQERGVTSA